MSLVHTQCPAPDDTPSVYVTDKTGTVHCDHCGRKLIPLIDLPVTIEMETSPDVDLDRIARLVRQMLDVPRASVTLVDQKHQAFPGLSGFPDRETPLSSSFCQYVVMSSAPLIVQDARLDPVVADSEATKQGVIAYAGMPVRDMHGDVIGSLCAIDVKPREWTEAQLKMLSDFADLTTADLQRRDALRVVKEVLVALADNGIA